MKMVTIRKINKLYCCVQGGMVLFTVDWDSFYMNFNSKNSIYTILYLFYDI